LSAPPLAHFHLFLFARTGCFKPVQIQDQEKVGRREFSRSRRARVQETMATPSGNNDRGLAMNKIHPVRSELEELAHRRRLTTARQSRATERSALLEEIIQTEQRALELREWLVRQETRGENPLPEIRPLIQWAKAALADMQRFLAPSELTKLLQARDLFPEIDDLADPLGDPPPLRPWGR
jgi:hypothetical protein